MPKLSSADTPPAKSSACLPVSTIALSGVMIRMPRVCMSIVASAFQYGWAPTLMPVTMTLISPPCCVNSMIRRSAAATQSMFSVPESIEIRAPDDNANHSTGTPSSSAMSSAAMIRRHSGSATLAERLRRVAQQHQRASCPRGSAVVKERVRPTTIAGVVHRRPAVDRDQVALVVEVVLDELAARDRAGAGRAARARAP